MVSHAAASGSFAPEFGPQGAYTVKDLTVKGAASGPLTGTSFAVKDLFDVRPMLAFNGCFLFLVFPCNGHAQILCMLYVLTAR